MVSNERPMRKRLSSSFSCHWTEKNNGQETLYTVQYNEGEDNFQITTTDENGLNHPMKMALENFYLLLDWMDEKVPTAFKSYRP